MNKNIRINIFLNTFGSIFYSICQWLLTIIVVKVASYETAGYLSLAMTTSSSFSAIALFSIRNYQISDVTEEYSNNVYLGSRLLTCLLSFICCFFSSFSTNTIYQFSCIMAFMLIRIVEAITDVLHGINQKYNRYDYIAISYILRGSITAFSFYILLSTSKNLFWTLFITAILNLFIAFGFDWKKTYSIDHFKITIFDKYIWKLLKRCTPLVIFTFLLSLENLIPKKILQAEYGASYLGIYSSIASPTLIIQVFATVAFGPFLPVISNIIHRGEINKFKNIIHRIYFIFIGMSIVIILGAILLGRLVLCLLFGEKILYYYSIFIPIIWCTILTGIVWILSSIVVALRKIKVLLLGKFLDFFICIMLSKYLIKSIGMNGVSIIQIIVLLINIFIMILICESTNINKNIEQNQ